MLYYIRPGCIFQAYLKIFSEEKHSTTREFDTYKISDI